MPDETIESLRAQLAEAREERRKQFEMRTQESAKLTADIEALLPLAKYAFADLVIESPWAGELPTDEQRKAGRAVIERHSAA